MTPSRKSDASPVPHYEPESERTLGDALVAAKQATDDAERAFREMLTEASNRGASVREMASLLGMSHSTLWRWMEGHGRRRTNSVLSEPRSPAPVHREEGKR